MLDQCCANVFRHWPSINPAHDDPCLMFPRAIIAHVVCVLTTVRSARSETAAWRRFKVGPASQTPGRPWTHVLYLWDVVFADPSGAPEKRRDLLKRMRPNKGACSRASYDISQASDWSRWPSRPIRSLRYIVTCTRIRALESDMEFCIAVIKRYMWGIHNGRHVCSAKPRSSNC